MNAVKVMVKAMKTLVKAIKVMVKSVMVMVKAIKGMSRHSNHDKHHYGQGQVSRASRT